MNPKFTILLPLFFSTLISQEFVVHHTLQVEIDHKTSYVMVTDQVKLPEDYKNNQLTFKLHGSLNLKNTEDTYSIQLIDPNAQGMDKGMDVEDFGDESPVPLKSYRITFSDIEPKTEFTIKYEGKINHPIKQIGSEYARGFSQTPGIIDTQGVYLSGSTYWIPSFENEYVTYELTVSTPLGWSTVSQGKRLSSDDSTLKHIDKWIVDTATEEIYIIAARFHEYNYPAGSVSAMAFLRTQDETLANKYLETTAQYMEMYRNLLGPYPYSKFALVENFWETGYGMPSFTLLGEQIIRFPFILHSSYPHELLHNWWGNSVYVDFNTGNWCEGLTAYMADHLIAEQRGKGADYRRSTLQRYTDYVDESNDFPLNQFISRYDAPTEAVGYGKSMMTWDMLREMIGDKFFIKGFQTFYRNNKFKRAGFQDIQSAFEEVSGLDLSSFFEQWIDRTGAPELRLSKTKIKTHPDGYTLKFQLNQIQSGLPYDLDVPVAIYTQNNVTTRKINLSKSKQKYSIKLTEKPIKIAIDPQFNLFRKLHHNEIPPSLSKAFGAGKITLVLPSEGPDRKKYEELVQIWASEDPDKFQIINDRELKSLPKNRSIWILGWNNTWKKMIEKGVKGYDTDLTDNFVRFGKTELSRGKNSHVIAVRHPKNPNLVVIWLTIHDTKAVKGLVRKLPHYGKYSYLGFTGSEPGNVAKGQWSSVGSPLVADLTSKHITPGKELDSRPALAQLAPVFSAERMLNHVSILAGDSLKGRGLGTVAIDKAADYIASQFLNSGLFPGGDGDSYFQNFTALYGPEGNSAPARNVIGFIPGTDPDMKEESLVISAHYDHLGFGWPDVTAGNKGKIHHGADDNASGVATMLELAKILGKSFKPKRTVIFIAFTGEESGLQGAKYYVKNPLGYPISKVIANLNLDTVGLLGSNKLLILNGNTSTEWKFIFMGTGYVTGIPTELPSQVVASSDQAAFIEAGVPAVQFFAGSSPDYHKPTDTTDKIDADGMVKVATVAREVLVYLADRIEPLSFTGERKETVSSTANKRIRRASTGTMPDFSYNEKGVKIASISENSPAETAGLEVGDIIVQLSSYTIDNLKSYSDALKKYKPGDEISIKYVRNEKEYVTKLTLTER